MIHICAKSMMKFYHRKYMLQKIMIYDDLMMTIWRSDPTWRASNSLDRLPSGLECCNSPRRTRSLGSSQSLSILILQQRWPFLYYHHNNHRNGCVVAWKGNFSFINGSWKCYFKAILKHFDILSGFKHFDIQKNLSFLDKKNSPLLVLRRLPTFSLLRIRPILWSSDIFIIGHWQYYLSHLSPAFKASKSSWEIIIIIINIITNTCAAGTGCKGTYRGDQWLQPRQCSLIIKIMTWSNRHDR